MVSESVLDQADKLLTASKSLDYQRIIDHDSEEVARLKGVLSDLSVKPKGADESLDDYASKSVAGDGGNSSAGQDSNASQGNAVKQGDNGSEQRAAAVQRRQGIMACLSKEGFGDRTGQVYNSFASSRSVPFKQVPHKRGLPEFDMVMAPDFAPVAGLHGVFISDSEVMSVILPSDNPDVDWEILKRKSYSNEEEMLEFITLIAAGFDLP